jgi:hypothetical protein
VILFAAPALDSRRTFELADAHAFTSQTLVRFFLRDKDGGYSKSIPSSPRYNLTKLTWRDANRLSVQAAGARFELTKRPRFSWVEVEAVRVVVERFEQLDGYFETGAGAVEPAHFYVAEIDKPEGAGPQSFQCRLLPHEVGKIDDAPVTWEQGSVQLRDNTPKPFVVRIVASTGGVYTYRIEVDLRQRWQSQTIVICRDQRLSCQGRETEGEYTPPHPVPAKPNRR